MRKIKWGFIFWTSRDRAFFFIDREKNEIVFPDRVYPSRVERSARFLFVETGLYPFQALTIFFTKKGSLCV